jgi:glycerophosphoryl diester phosphodiesterase
VITLVIAHRGASAYAQEHTLEAYDLALEMGADALELDIRCTADGEIVVLHDATLKRTARDPRRVSSITGAEARELGVLTLDAVLSRYGDRTRYLIEIKDRHHACGSRLVEAIARHGLADRVVVQSFDRLALRAMRRTGAALPLAALSRWVVPAANVRRGLHRTTMTAVVPWHTHVDAALVDAAHARGVAVYAYTVNEEAEMERLVGVGVDAVISDRPDILRAVVDRRLALAA